MKCRPEPSLERLVETLDVGLELLHPGGLEITRELARACGIGSGTAVLDVACGTGESACHLTEDCAAAVTGLDATPALLERGRAKAAARGLGPRFVAGDAHRLPFRDESFDVAISECTLSLLEKETALREMARVVRPGGHVGMHELCWKASAPAALRDRLAELEGERPETLEGWAALFERVGLVGVKALDRSPVLSRWIDEARAEIGRRHLLGIYVQVLRRWGWRGARRVLATLRIFGSEHLGYGLVVGRKG